MNCSSIKLLMFLKNTSVRSNMYKKTKLCLAVNIKESQCDSPLKVFLVQNKHGHTCATYMHIKVFQILSLLFNKTPIQKWLIQNILSFFSLSYNEHVANINIPFWSSLCISPECLLMWLVRALVLLHNVLCQRWNKRRCCSWKA